jgi:hypothetical protein
MYQLIGVSVVVPLTSWKPSHQPAYGRQYSPNRWASPDTSGSFSPSMMVFEVPSVSSAIRIRMAAGVDGGMKQEAHIPGMSALLEAQPDRVEPL